MKLGKLVSGAVLSLFMGGVAISSAIAQTPPATFPADKGPATINVSKYPANMQKAYKLLLERCTKCHTAARYVSSNKFGKATWEPIMHKMATRPGSDVTPEEEKVLLDFVVFDHDKRKAEINKFWATQPKKN